MCSRMYVREKYSSGGTYSHKWPVMWAACMVHRTVAAGMP